MKRSMLLTIGMLVILLGLVPQVWALPDNIYKTDSIVVDGNLGDWANAQWTDIAVNYVDFPTLDNASFALAWSDTNNKIYVAIRTKEASHVFLDENLPGSTQQDMVEIYVHTTGTFIDRWNVQGGTDYSVYQAAAQQYGIGIKPSNTTTVWTNFPACSQAIPPSAGFTAAGREGADGWVYYEASMTPFEYYGGLMTVLPMLPPTPVIPTDMTAGMSVGIDLTVTDNDISETTGLPTFIGMKSENTLVSKYNNYLQIATHTLSNTVLVVPSVTPPPDPTPSPTITPTPSPTPPVVDGVVNIKNAQFDYPTVPIDFRWDAATDWTRAGDRTMYTHHNADLPFGAPDGTNQYMQSHSNTAFIFQNTGVQYIEGMKYTLSFVSGNWLYAVPDAKYYVSFCAADSATAIQAGTTIGTMELSENSVTETWFPYSFSYNSGPESAGKYIVVKLGPGTEDVPTWDNISVTYAAAAHGNVILADYDPVDYTVPIAIKIVAFDEGWNILYSGTRQLPGGPSGEFYIPELPAGDCYVAVKAYGHLAKVVPLSVVSGAMAELGDIELGGGDCHGDNEVFFTSLSIVLKWFGTSGDGDPF